MAVIRYSWNSWLPMTVAELKTIAFYHPEFEFEMIIEGANPVAISELADERELKEDTLIIKRKTLSETSFPNHLLPVGEIKYTPDSISQLEEDPLHPTSKRVSDGAIGSSADARARISLNPEPGRYTIDARTADADGPVTSLTVDVGWCADASADIYRFDVMWQLKRLNYCGCCVLHIKEFANRTTIAPQRHFIASIGEFLN